VNGRKVFVMGTGGAGRAVAVQSAIEGAGELLLCDREEERAEILAGHLTDDLSYGPVKAVPFDERTIKESLSEAEILVDATPLGMHEDDPTSVNVDWLHPGVFVIDLVYRPAETPLLKGARERGCRTMNGLGMLLYQGAKAFEIWTGVDAPLHVMRPALEAAVYGRKTN
jgi:shikimate dehydrogenase